jgi:MoxR-like ATPase
VHDEFYVIATGNPSRFHGRLELPMSLQTRFTTVLLQPIQPDELMLIIKDKAPDLTDDEARRWCGDFFAAKRNTPTLTTRTLWEALKGTAGCSNGASEIKLLTATATAAVAHDCELHDSSSSQNIDVDGGRVRIAVWFFATVVLGEIFSGFRLIDGHIC